MNFKPLVSVNITTFNRSKMLVRAIKSIQSQTFKDLEIVIADDASIDNTKSVVERLRRKDKRIKYIRHTKNKGNAFARNTALKNSLGKYIAFLDDDDEWIDKNKLKKQLKIFQAADDTLAIVSTGVMIVDEHGNKRKVAPRIPRDLKRYILKRNGIIYSPTVLTKRNIMKRVGGFDLKLQRGIDSEFYRACIVTYGYEVIILPDVTTRVYEHAGVRKTPVDTKTALFRVIYANTYILWKYRKYIIKYPDFLFNRLRSVLLQTLGYSKILLKNLFS